MPLFHKSQVLLSRVQGTSWSHLSQQVTRVSPLSAQLRIPDYARHLPPSLFIPPPVTLSFPSHLSDVDNSVPYNVPHQWHWFLVKARFPMLPPPLYSISHLHLIYRVLTAFAPVQRTLSTTLLFCQRHLPSVWTFGPCGWLFNQPVDAESRSCRLVDGTAFPPEASSAHVCRFRFRGCCLT